MLYLHIIYFYLNLSIHAESGRVVVVNYREMKLATIAAAQNINRRFS